MLHTVYPQFFHHAAATLKIMLPLLLATSWAWSNPNSVIAGPSGTAMGLETKDYQAGKQALASRKWQEAIKHFNRVLDDKDANADAAYYWKATALVQLQQKQAALEVLTQLVKTYPKSQWRDDAEELMLEIRGHSPEATDGINPNMQDDELKLIAISSLIHADPQRAVPLLAGIVAGQNSSQIKQKALFALSQIPTQEAFAVIKQAIEAHPDRQTRMEAIQILALEASPSTMDYLRSIYQNSQDAKLKETLLGSFMVLGAAKQLLEIYAEETDPETKSQVIKQLGIVGAVSDLDRLLLKEDTPISNKSDILDAFFLAGDQQRLMNVALDTSIPELRTNAIEKLGLLGACDRIQALLDGDLNLQDRETAVRYLFVGACPQMVDIARNDPTPKIRKAAIEAMGISGGKMADTLIDIYDNESDPAIKSSILNALFISDQPKALSDIFYAEQNADLKKQALQYLSHMQAPETTEIFKQILEKD